MGILSSILSRLKPIAKQILYGAAPVWNTHLNQHFPGYSPADLWVFNKFRNISTINEPGFLINYLGVRTNADFLPAKYRQLVGSRQGIPVPEDWNADAVEHIGLLKSVHDARGKYRVMELGASWGDWMVNGSVAARHLGISDIRMLGVEADSGHFNSIIQHLIDNGFDPEDHIVLNSVVGSSTGMAQFPKIRDYTNQLACRPVYRGSSSDILYLKSLLGNALPEMEEVAVVGIKELLVKEEIWDLVHIDIQGWEFEICQAGINEMSKRVSRVIIGTHSRKIDGDLIELFFNSGWILEHEKPVQFVFSPEIDTLEAMTKVDGTQVWCNPNVWKKGYRPFLKD